MQLSGYAPTRQAHFFSQNQTNMKTLNKELIEKLRNGDIVAKNTGSVDEIQEIVKAAFPRSPAPTGGAKFYKKGNVFNWTYLIYPPKLPIHPVSDFFIDEEQSVDIEEELKWGEPVVVRGSENGNWQDGYIYVGRNPIICGIHLVIDERYGIASTWKFCKRKPSKPRFSRAEYAQKLGISIDQIDDVELVD